MNNSTSRRNFIKFAAIASGTSLIGSTGLAENGCETEWTKLTEGLWQKKLWTSGEDEAAASLFRLGPNFKFAHSHPEGELNFFTKGEIEIDGVVYRPGDFLEMEPGSCHSGSSGTSGCEVLVYLPKPIIPSNTLECERTK